MKCVHAGSFRFLSGFLFFSTLLCNGAVFAQTQDTRAEALLRSRDAEFSKDIVTVAPGVYTAVGYSPGNASMIVGVDGVVIIDTGQDPAQAAGIVDAFKAISNLPVLGIIYTHGHGDHTGGASAFIGAQAPQIWALENFGSEDRPLAAAKLVVQQDRGTKQAGFALPDALRINNGIAPAMRPNRANAFAAGTTAAAGSTNSAAPSTSPNRTFPGGRIAIEIAGVKLELVEAPARPVTSSTYGIQRKGCCLPVTITTNRFPTFMPSGERLTAMYWPGPTAST